jgi:hypothetical protein
MVFAVQNRMRRGDAQIGCIAETRAQPVAVSARAAVLSPGGKKERARVSFSDRRVVAAL